MHKYTSTQPMRIQARAGSPAERYYHEAALPGRSWPMPKARGAGISPAPLEDLIFHGGKVVPQIEFQNIYLGGQASWGPKDIESIDASILRAMQHKGLNNVMSQYFPGASLSCDMRKSFVLEKPKPMQIDERDVQRLVANLYDDSLINKSGLEACIFNLVLPSTTVLQLGNLTSSNGLGGYHGSVHVERQGARVTIYYSANVFSERAADGSENGIVAFDQPWKNVVATLYHELNEFRTDPDVNDAVEQGDNDFLGWTSGSGREVGDQPIFQAGAARNLGLVFQQVKDSAGKTFPVQFMYSNAVHGAEGPIPAPD